MKINVRIVASLFLVCITFFLVLSMLDFVIMGFWGQQVGFANAPWLYNYWMVLTLVVLVVGFAVSFVAYITKLPINACVLMFLTFPALYAGGLLDEFYELFCFVQNMSYNWNVWSFGYKVFVANGFLGGWGWFEQLVWSSIFYGAVVAAWVWLLRKK